MTTSAKKRNAIQRLKKALQSKYETARPAPIAGAVGSGKLYIGGQIYDGVVDGATQVVNTGRPAAAAYSAKAGGTTIVRNTTSSDTTGGTGIDVSILPLITLIANPDLTNERYLAVSSALSLTDSGPGAALTVGMATPGTLTVSSTNVDTGSHTHAITASSAPGAASAILKSDSSGALTLPQFTATTKVRTPLIDTASGDLTISPVNDLLLNPTSKKAKAYAALLSVGASGATFGTVMQYVVDADNSYSRFFVGHNAIWNAATDVWDIADSGGTVNDSGGLLMENNVGKLHFIFHTSTGSGTRTMNHATFTAGAKFTMTSAGRLGILNTAPSYELDVTGAARITTSLTTPLITTVGAGIDLTLSPSDDIVLSPGSNLVKLATSKVIQSDNYASQVTGMRITHDGQADFRYLFVDEMHAKAFIADLEQALAGGQIIAKSVAVLYSDFTAPAAGATASLTVRDLPSATGMAAFQNGDYIRIRTFSRSAGSLTIADCWGTVVLDTSYGTSGFDSATKTQRYTFTRSTSPNAGAMTAGTVVYADAIILDYGTSGNGFYEVNAIDGAYAVNSPYAQIVTWSGHPRTQTVRARLGNLYGIWAQSGEHGLYAGDGTADTNQYLRISNTGVRLNNIPLRLHASGVQKVNIDSAGTDIWVGTSSSDKRLIWDGTTLTVTGQIVVQSGSSGYANITDKPTNLSAINSSEGSKLAGIEAGATVGATWGTNLNSIPTRFGNAPSSAGLYLTPTHMGYYNGSAWKAWIASSGEFYFGGSSGAHLEWNGSKLRGIGTDGSTEQWYAQASDGKLYAGAGNVILHASGVDLQQDGYITPDESRAITWWPNIASQTGNPSQSIKAFYNGLNYNVLEMEARGQGGAFTDSQVTLTAITSAGVSKSATLYSDGAFALPGSLSVTTDITVGGLVDGVDIAAFKSAYDTHNHDSRYYTESESDARFLQLTGGTLTGTLNSRTVIPTANNTYDLGSSSNYFNNAYVRNLYTDTIVGTPSYSHTHAAADITSGTLSDSRLPTTMAGKTFSSAIIIDADTGTTSNYVRWLTQTTTGKSWDLTGRAHDYATSSQQNDLLLTYYDGSTIYTVLQADSATRVVDFGQTPTVAGTAVSLAGHTHDDRYYTESEVNSLLTGYVPTSRTVTAGSGLTGGGALSSNITISHFDTSTQASSSNSGTTFIQSITLDDYGHITALATADSATALDSRYVNVSGDTMTGLLTLSSSTDEMARFDSTSATGNPYVTFYQSGTRRSFIQHNDTEDNLIIASEFGKISLKTHSSGSETDRMVIDASGAITMTGNLAMSGTLTQTNTNAQIVVQNSTPTSYGALRITSFSQTLTFFVNNIYSGSGDPLTNSTFAVDPGAYNTGAGQFRYHGNARAWEFYDAGASTGIGNTVSMTAIASLSKAAVWLSPRGTAADLYIKSDGNVGIGTSVPSYKLDISGAMRATGVIYAGNDIEITGELLAANGTAGAPSVSFLSDTDTGIYRSGANTFDIATGGAQRVSVSSAGATVTGSVTASTSVITPTVTTASGNLTLSSTGGTVAVTGALTASSTAAVTTSVATPLLTTNSGNLTIAGASDILLDPTSNLVKLTSGVSFQSDNYASQVTGMRVTYDGQADFRYLFVDEMHAKSFIADLEQALAGGQIIAKSVAVLYSDFTAPAAGATASLTVRDLPSATGMAAFQNGDYVRIRTFSRASGSLTIADCWGTVTLDATYGTSGFDSATKTQRYTFTRSASPNEGAMTAGTVVVADAIILDYGTSGNGFYEVNAIDGAYAANSPYAQIVTWSGHPKTQTVRARLGNLYGIWSVSNEYGLYAGSGIANTDQYLRISNSGVQINNVPIKLYNSGTQTVNIDSAGTDIWVGPSSGDKRLSWNGSTLTVTGQIVVQSGSSGYANITDKPTNLSAINSSEGSKLAGIEAGATVGATWGTNLNSIPTRFGNAPSSAGLYLTPTHMGYYNGSAWKAWIASSGEFYFGGSSGAHLEWNGSKLRGIGADGTTEQWYAQASDGKLYAGAGAVSLDASGVRVTAVAVSALSNTNAYRFETSGGAVLGGLYGRHYVNNYDIFLQTSGDATNDAWTRVEALGHASNNDANVMLYATNNPATLTYEAYVWLDVDSSSAVLRLQADSGILLESATSASADVSPTTTLGANLGSGSKQWSTIYVATVTASNAITVGGTNVSLSGHTHDDRYYTESELNAGQLNNLYYTESETDTFLNAKLNLSGGTMTGTLTSRTVTPSANNTYDLGGASAYWNNAYINNLYTNTIVGTPSYSHTHAATDITSGTLNLARIPATLTGKDADTLDTYHAASFVLETGDSMSGSLTMNASLVIDADTGLTSNYVRWLTQTSTGKAWDLTGRAHDYATSSQQNDLLLTYYDGTTVYTAFQADSSTRIIDFAQTPTVGGTAVSLAGHTHDDRYYTESEINSTLAGYVPTSRTVTAGAGLTGGGALSGNITISHFDTSTQASSSNSGTTFIQSITLDDYGHITALTTADSATALDSRYVNVSGDTMTGLLTLSSSTDEMARFDSTSATGNPYITFYQSGTRRSFIQHNDTEDNLIIASEFGKISLKTHSSGSETDRMVIDASGAITMTGNLAMSGTLTQTNTNAQIVVQNSTPTSYGALRITSFSQTLTFFVNNIYSGSGDPLTNSTFAVDPGAYNTGAGQFRYHGNARAWEFYDAGASTGIGNTATMTAIASLSKAAVWLSPRGTAADLYIKSDGNVGVGTSVPSYKLDISGAMRATDVIYAGNDIEMTGELLAANGSAATPSISFLSDTDNGLYRSTTNTWHLVAGAAAVQTITASGISVSGTITGSSTATLTTSVSAPLYTAASGNLTVSAPATLLLNAASANTVDLQVAGATQWSASDARLNPRSSVVMDIGDYNRKVRTLYAAEMYVETLVAQDVMATIGGRVMVAPTTTLIADLSSTITTSTLYDGLISYWQLNETSGNRADSRGSNTLTDTNTVTYATGKQSNAALFTKANSEYLTIADNASLSVGDIDFYIACWVYPTSDDNVAQYIVTKGGATNNIAFRLWLDWNANQFKFEVYNSSNVATTVTATSFGTVTASTWYFVEAWHDSVNNQIGIGVNAVNNTTAHTTGVKDDTGPFQIGASNGASFFDGRIDEVGFWKYMPTSTDRTFLYNSGSGRTYTNISKWTTIDLKHNSYSAGTYIYLQTAPGGVPQIEAMQVTGAGSAITGGYRYRVVRDLDGTGANSWVAGDAAVSLGAALGSGYIDLASTNTIHSQLGPTITVFARSSVDTWNGVKPVVTMGNLRSFVDYVADEYGQAAGNDLALTPATGFAGYTIDRTNGLRLFNTEMKLYSGATEALRINPSVGVRLTTGAGAINMLSWYNAIGGYDQAVIRGDLVSGTASLNLRAVAKDTGTGAFSGYADVILSNAVTTSAVKLLSYDGSTNRHFQIDQTGASLTNADLDMNGSDIYDVDSIGLGYSSPGGNWTSVNWKKSIEFGSQGTALVWRKAASGVARGIGVSSDGVLYIAQSGASDTSSAATYDATFDNNGNLSVRNAISTALAASWDLGAYTATAPSATGYVTIKINGTTYKLLASNV